MTSVKDLEKALYGKKYTRTFYIKMYEEEAILVVAVTVGLFDRLMLALSGNYAKKLNMDLKQLVAPIEDMGIKVEIFITL